jgi:hypothetical protein
MIGAVVVTDCRDVYRASNPRGCGSGYFARLSLTAGDSNQVEQVQIGKKLLAESEWFFSSH